VTIFAVQAVLTATPSQSCNENKKRPET
jgi:hypothetical protein